jgi:hypothetical protein
MKSLKTLQESLANSVYDNEDTEISELVQSKKIATNERLQIYKDNVLITLYETLKNRYPVVCRLVDERFFKYAVNEYIKLHKPTSGNLDDYGFNFIGFLKEFPPTKEMHYLSDVATLEWGLHIAYFSADATPIDKEELAKIAPEEYENLRFSLHPSASLISSKYPIDKIWDYTGDGDIDINARGTDFLVIRPEYKTGMILLESGEFNFLAQLQSGRKLYEAYEAATLSNAKFDVGTAIRKFVLNGALVGFQA